MPRQQRGRRRPSRSGTMPPYRKRRQISDLINGTLPDDALAAIFARLPDTADVVRCAATCTRWRRAVATRAASLSHSLPPPGRFLPQLAVGLFHLEKHGPTARTRTAPGAPQPRFLAMASGRRLLGCQRTCIGSLFRGVDDGGAIFDFSRPVASRNGRLVLELQRESRADGGVTLCVCNPMTGDVVVLPVLEGVDKPADYGCALLAGDDLRPRRCTTNFFHLLLVVYNSRRHGFTALRCFSSDTGRWGAETRSPVPASANELRHIGPAAVLHGAAFWPLDHGVLGVRPAAGDDLQAAVVHLLPYEWPHYWPEKRLLGVSPDNRLFFINFGLLAGNFTLIANITYFDIRGDDIRTGRQPTHYEIHGDDIRTGRIQGSPFQERIRMPQMKLACRDTTLKLRWVGEKSGIVLFTLGESSGHSGTFALSLRERTVEKLAHGEGHEWGSFIGFEMDWATYLALRQSLLMEETEFFFFFPHEDTTHAN